MLTDALKFRHEMVRTMRFRDFLKSLTNSGVNRDRTRKKTSRAARFNGFSQKIFRLFFKIFERQIHRLEHGVAGADLRAKGDKSNMLVKLLLSRGAGNNRQIVTVLQTVLPHQGGQTAKNLAVAE